MGVAWWAWFPTIKLYWSFFFSLGGGIFFTMEKKQIWGFFWAVIFLGYGGIKEANEES
jgi:hypothetical protein